MIDKTFTMKSVPLQDFQTDETSCDHLGVQMK